ncbi:MAG: hypothetical protein HYT98_01615 [Candidatus Sungbacteria bacterium]|nr:hypothetical protein [Candidatus Sungbacteria bacterium]
MPDPKIGDLCLFDQIPVGAVFQAYNKKGEPFQAYFVKDTPEWVFQARQLEKNKWKRAGGAGGYVGRICKYIAGPENVEPDSPDIIRPL